jgi:hypothetical protein
MRQIQTITSKHISKPEIGYPVSFTQMSLSDLRSLDLDELAATYENIPRRPGQLRDQLKEEQLIVRSLAETPEKALEVAKDHCGQFGRDFRVVPLEESAPLLNDYDHKFTREDLLTIAKSEGKTVQKLGETMTQRFELWEVEGIEGSFVTGGGATRYLSTLSPLQTMAQLDRLERESVKRVAHHDESMRKFFLKGGFQETVDVLVYLDREELRRQERAAQIEAGYTKKDDSYRLDDGKFGFFADLTPRDGVFDVKVWTSDYSYAVDRDLGPIYDTEVYVEREEQDLLNTRELTVDGVRTSLLKYGITLPPGLAKALSVQREEYWQGHADEINKIAGDLKDVLTEVIYNDMSAADAEERWVGTAELAQETLSRADLVGNEDEPKIRGMVQALRDIAAADQTKEPHVIAGEALAGVGEMITPGRVERVVLNQSPDDRFPTLDAYEAALERIEEGGIARIEARDAALYKALEDIHTAGKNCISQEGVQEIIRLASKPLGEYNKDLHSTWISSHEQVMHLALATIKYSEGRYTLTSSKYDPKEVKKAADSFAGALELLIKWDRQGLHVNGNSIDHIAEATYNTGLHYPAHSHVEFGAQVSAIAGAALDQVNSMRHSIDQVVSPDWQQTNEVRQGNSAGGISL